MRKQIVVITRKRVRVRAILERPDLSTDIPLFDQMQEFANEVLDERFPGTDTSAWDATYRLQAPPSQYDGAWGAVDFMLRQNDCAARAEHLPTDQR